MPSEHHKEFITCRAAGTIGGFNERCQGGTKSFSHTLQQFDIDVHLQELLQHDKFELVSLDHLILYFGRF